MNARQNFGTIADINRATAKAKEALADIQALGPVQMPVTSFNDDDVYIYDAATKQLVQQIGSGSPRIANVRHHGLAVMAGQSWAKGMTAKSLGLWRQV